MAPRSSRPGILLLVLMELLPQAGGDTEVGGSLDLRLTFLPSTLLHKLILPLFSPLAFPPLHHLPSLLSTSVSSPLPFSFIDHQLMLGKRDGAVIKEADRSVNSARRRMESTRSSDGPNRALHCKQHAHLDSSRPQGETGESCCRQVSADEERKFPTTDVVVCAWKIQKG